MENNNTSNNTSNNKARPKKTSRLLMTAAVFIVIAALLFCGGMFALGWDFYKLDISTYTAKAWTQQTGEITSLSINVSGRDVTVNYVEEDEASATWFDCETERLEVSFSAGKLTVKEKFVWKFGSFFSFTDKDKSIVIINITSSSLTELEVKQSGGRLKINGIEAATRIKYRQSGGKAEFGGIAADSLSYSGSGGEIRLNDINARTIAVDQSGGRSYFESIDTVNFSFNTSGGRLSFDGLKADTLDIKTSGGSISGTITGDISEYAVSISKSGGSCNLKERSGVFVAGKRIKIKQSGGSINLSFGIVITII